MDWYIFILENTL